MSLEVEYENDVSGTVVFENLTHTMGNLLQHYISQDEGTVFVGYVIPHPLQTQLRLKIVHSEKDPITCVNDACKIIIQDTQLLLTQLEPYIYQPNSTNEEQLMQDE